MYVFALRVLVPVYIDLVLAPPLRRTIYEIITRSNKCHLLSNDNGIATETHDIRDYNKE